jgi:hypothetical protein
MARKKVQTRNSWLQSKPPEGEAWANDFLERFHRAGESTEARVLAAIGARASAYGNKAYAQAILFAARGVLAATNNEDRARQLFNFARLLHLAAVRSGRQDHKDHMDERAQIARSGLSAKRTERLLAIERAMKANGSKPTRGIGYAKLIRPTALKEIGLREDAESPSAVTIKRGVCDILETIPGFRREAQRS